MDPPATNDINNTSVGNDVIKPCKEISSNAIPIENNVTFQILRVSDGKIGTTDSRENIESPIIATDSTESSPTTESAVDVTVSTSTIAAPQLAKSEEHNEDTIDQSVTLQVLNNDEKSPSNNTDNDYNNNVDNTDANNSSMGNRFRFIKVDRSYTRGRWKCDDYADFDQSHHVTDADNNEKDEDPTDLPSTLELDESSNEMITNQNQLNSNGLTDILRRIMDEILNCISLEESSSDQILLKEVTSHCGSNEDMLLKTRRLVKQYDASDILTNISSLPQTNIMQTFLHASDVLQQHVNHALVDENSLISTSYDAVLSCSSEEEIDAKIEAAMDLVKSHLTNAVREEVAELKHRIKTLMDANNLLEKEITLLRRYVTPEVVSNIQSTLYSENASSSPPTSNLPRQSSSSDH